MSVNKPRYESTRILSVFVNTKAVAFVIMESALDVIHMQRIPFESVHNEKLLQKVKDVITFSSPITVVLEDPHSKYSRKSKRIKNLIKRFSEYSQEVKVPVKSYSREDIRDTFARWKATTKYEVAEVICQNLPKLKPYLYDKPQHPYKEAKMTPVFDAISLGITHYFLAD